MLSNLFCLLCSFLTKVNFVGFQDWIVLRWVSGGANQTAWITYWKFKIGRETQKKRIYRSKVKWSFLSNLVAFSKNTNFTTDRAATKQLSYPIINFLVRPSDRCRTPPWPLLPPQQPLNSTNRLPLRPLTYKNPWTRGSAGVQPPWELGVHYQVCTLHFLINIQVQ